MYIYLYMCMVNHDYTIDNTDIVVLILSYNIRLE